MKLQTKSALFISFFITLLVAAISAISIFNIRSNAQEQIDKYRQSTLANKHQELKEKTAIVYNLIDTEISLLNDKDHIEVEFGQNVENIVEAATTILESYNNKYKKGELSLAQAQAEAKERIKAIRYDNRTGYVWINDTQYPYPKMIMHPTQSELDGQDLSHSKFNTSTSGGKNQNFYVASTQIAQDNPEGGFVDYMSPKPSKDGLSKIMSPKIAYVYLYKPWNWVVGSGIYIDTAREQQISRLKETIRLMRFGANNQGYFWINDTTTPVPKIVLHPLIPALEGKVANNPQFNLGNNKTLFAEFAKKVKANNGEAIYDYKWPKKTHKGTTPNVPKSSYIRYYEPLDWVIGTGIYLDDLDAEVEKKKAEVNKETLSVLYKILGISLVLLIISVIATEFVTRKISKSIMKLTEVADDISKGKNMDQDIEGADRKDEIGQLAQAIARLQTSVNITMKRLMKK